MNIYHVTKFTPSGKQRNHIGYYTANSLEDVIKIFPGSYKKGFFVEVITIRSLPNEPIN